MAAYQDFRLDQTFRQPLTRLARGAPDCVHWPIFGERLYYNSENQLCNHIAWRNRCVIHCLAMPCATAALARLGRARPEGDELDFGALGH